MVMLIALATLALLASPAPPADPLALGFVNPPASAKPHTWWHWMDGNVTKAGITADLEAMSKAGIGGAQMFTVAVGIPAGRVGYMGTEWRALMTHAVKEAGRVGVELCIHNCAGWSSSGGPWITPENAMQVLAWSEKRVVGPTRFAETLAMPKAPQVAQPGALARLGDQFVCGVHRVSGVRSRRPADARSAASRTSGSGWGIR